MKTFVFIFLIVAFAQVFSQTANLPDSFNEIPDIQKQIVFNDEFDDNQNNWDLGKNSGRTASIEKGDFVLHSHNEVFQAIFKEVEIKQDMDFEVETSIKFIEGKTADAINLIFGMDKTYRRIDFGFNARGEFTIDKFERDYTDLVSFKRNEIINKYNYNTLTIRKFDNSLYFFINGEKVHQMNFPGLYGNFFGVQTANLTKIHIDYLKILAINKDTDKQPPQITLLYPPEARGVDNQKKEPIRTTKDKLTLSGKALTDNGVRELTVNGKKFEPARGGAFKIEIPLKIGKNEILIQVKDNNNLTQERKLEVIREELTQNKESDKTEFHKIALVLGNGDYQGASSLRNPANDASAISEVLKKMGFEVILKENTSQSEMKKTIDEFGTKLTKSQVALFFYAGHGIQSQGVNYLIPTDAIINNEKDVEYNCIDVGRVLAKMETNKATNIIILDACRNNPFERSWSRSTQGNGLAFMNAPAGSFIAYATSPGNTASDGPRDHGLYTSALLEYINIPGITIEQLFKQVRKKVREESQDKQIPWESTSLEGNFYFVEK